MSNILKLGLVCLFACHSVERNGTRVSLDTALHIERQGRAWLDSTAFASVHLQSLDVVESLGTFTFKENASADTPLTVRSVRATHEGLSFVLSNGSGTIAIADDGRVSIDWSAPGADRVVMTFACAPGERFFGMGSQVAVEHTGRRVPVWTSEQGVGKADYGETGSPLGIPGAFYDSYAPIAFAVSSAHRGFWLEESARAELDLCSSGALRIQVDGSHFRLHFYSGSSIAAIVEQFAKQTGTPPELPLWTFSPWVDVFGGPAAIADAAALLRARGTPVSAIWSEDWVGVVDTLLGENLSYNWEQDPSRFPNLSALTASLHARGFRFLTYMNPFVAQGTRAFSQAPLVQDAASQAMHISFPFGAPLYLFDPSEDASVYQQYVNAALAAGVDGWMADYGEYLPYKAVLADGRTGAQAHNDYPRLWAQANFDAMLAARPDGDFVTFNRSGSAGISAHTSVHWLGDQLTSFDRNDGLGSVLPLYLSSGLSGIALTHSDIGGYTSIGAVRDEELWSRWLELAAFTPVMRTHHTSSPATNLQWNSSETTIARFDKYARWHQRLLPYFSALAQEAHLNGTPAVRPIWWNEENAELFAVDQEVLVGEHLLLAPIVTQGAVSRNVVFPAGVWRRWRSFDAPLETARVEADARIDEAIVYVRGGAVIPLLAEDVASVDRVMPELQFLAVSGGRDEGSYGDLHWVWNAPEVFDPGLPISTDFGDMSGRMLTGAGEIVLRQGDKTAHLSLSGPARFRVE